MSKTRILLLFLAVLFFPTHVELGAAEWYKGALHCHSFWSDGDMLPELVFDWHRNKGYHFVSLTDHSHLQTDKNRWRSVDPALIEQSRKTFGDDWVETKEENGKTLVRLKTVWEMKEKLDEKGRFLVIPGMEQNTSVAGRVLHTIAANITETIPFPGHFATLAEGARDWRNRTFANAAQNDNEAFWMVNHPDWPYYDIPLTLFLEVPEIEFFELNISSPPSRPFQRHPSAPDTERYWDIINAFRAVEGQKLVFMVAADDAHHYRVFKDAGVNPGHGWVGVRSETLEPNAIFKAMKAGDFYSSTGVELKDVRFDTASRTLTVEVKPEEGVKYSIRFIGTKKDFDRNTTPFDDPAQDKKPARTGLVYSEDIGVTFKTVEGTSASYSMEPDDLYVRAVIVSDKKPEFLDRNEPATMTAWTQPVK